MRRLSGDVRLRVWNSAGTCNSKSGAHETALGYFEKLQGAASRRRDRHWLGQAYLNKGVVYHQMGHNSENDPLVQKERSLMRAEPKTRLLASRSLGNLAQLTVDDDPAPAVDLSNQSIRAKRAINDHQGVAGQYGGYWPLRSRSLATSGFCAMRLYRRDERLANKMDLRYLRVALGNLGQTLLESGRHVSAIRSVTQKSRSLAEEEGFNDLISRNLFE